MKLEDITVEEFFIKHNIDIKYFKPYFNDKYGYGIFLNYYEYFLKFGMKINNPEVIFFYKFVKKHWLKKQRLEKLKSINFY